MSKDCMRYRNPEERQKYKREWKREWRKRNPKKVKEQARKYRQSKRGKTANKRYREKLRLEVLIHYGGNPPKCICCEETIIEFLTIDHINNDGAKQKRSIGMIGHSGHGTQFYRWLRKNNYPDIGLQVLCYNCNCAKGHYGICPHKRKVYKEDYT